MLLEGQHAPGDGATRRFDTRHHQHQEEEFEFLFIELPPLAIRCQQNAGEILARLATTLARQFAAIAKGPSA